LILETLLPYSVEIINSKVFKAALQMPLSWGTCLFDTNIAVRCTFEINLAIIFYQYSGALHL